MWRLLAILACCTLSIFTCEAAYDKTKFKQIVFKDRSNDDAIYLNAQQLLKRSGFDYEEHYVVADDGYITLLIRIINPLVDRANLRSPPVMLFHGANLDQAAYLLSSSKQHHPEAYPRPQTNDDDNDDELPLTASSSRSLGFMLANNGYDVWLVGQRGSNKLSQAFTSNVAEARERENGVPPTKEEFEFIKKNRSQYWSYGLDNIIDYEIGRQIDKVRQVTGSSEVSMFTFSLSTPTTMAFLAKNPDYASNVRVYIQMAPAIAADHSTLFSKAYFELICPLFPTRGLGFTPTYSIKPLVRWSIIQGSKSNYLRYSLIRQIVALLFGSSPKFNTNLERNLLAHIFQPVSFKSIQHYCQNSVAKRLTKFDYGKKKNSEKYGTQAPPPYDISHLNVQHWVVISGTNDVLADQTTVQRLIETTSTPAPVEHIIVPYYNHLDFLGAVENAKYVNFPILEQLNKHSN